jgi:hypothetical protein
MWLGEFQAWTSESDDGLSWAPLQRLRRSESFYAFNVCVSHDAKHKQLLMGYHCGNFFDSESACLAKSPEVDGLSWTPLGGTTTRPHLNDSCKAIGACCGTLCESHADSSNCVRFDEGMGSYVLTRRQAFATHMTKPDKWRTIRGIQFGTARELDGGSCHEPGRSCPQGFELHSEWYFDREGKREYFRRQVCAVCVVLSLQPLSAHSVLLSPSPPNNIIIDLLPRCRAPRARPPARAAAAAAAAAVSVAAAAAVAVAAAAEAAAAAARRGGRSAHRRSGATRVAFSQLESVARRAQAALHTRHCLWLPTPLKGRAHI